MNRTLFALALAVGLVHLTGAARAEFLAQIRLEVTNLADVPISSINVGEYFELKAWVQDVRDPPPELASGVFAAYLNADYDAGLLTVNPLQSIQYGLAFNIARTGNLATDGEIVGAGASHSSIVAPGNAEQLLWTVTVHADAIGLATFTPSFDDLPGHDVLIFLKDDAVAASEINFVADSLTIVPEPTGLVLAAIAVVALGRHGWRRKRRCRGG